MASSAKLTTTTPAPTSTTTPLTPYFQRVQLVAETISAHSKLADEAANDLAVHVLHALSSIRENMR
jgi:uncharacterized protein DUF6307